MVLCCLFFGVRVSVTFHLVFVHIICSSVWTAEYPPFGTDGLSANLTELKLL